MARKKSKQSGVGHKDLVAGQQSVSKNPVSPGDAAGGGDAGLDRLARTNQAMHTCCLLCHREFKDWGAGLANGLPGHAPKLADTVPALSQASGRKLGDAVPSLSQSLLGEVPLWICQSCRKSVEEEERRTAQEQCGPVPMSHSSSCKSQSCGNGYPEQNSVDWDPSSFLSARKLSGLWNSAHTNTGAHCTHSAASHAQQAGGPAGPTCHDKRSSHEASGTRVCPYSHAAPSPGLGATPTATPLTADLCKTTPKHFKTMCRRPTPPGEAFHPSEQHPPADLSVPPNSPTGLSSQSPALLPPAKPSPGQHAHSPTSPHSPFSTLAPGLAPGSAPAGKHSAADGPGSLHKPGACKNAHGNAHGPPAAGPQHGNTHGPPAAGPQHGKLGTSLMGCTHPCNGHNGSGGGGVTTSTAAHLTASTCRDQACKGHKLANGSACQQGACEQDEGEDEDSSSERSSCASSSTNQRDGKYCDCCYCEFFGHNAPPAAPTSRNYAEIREKLRSRLTRRKEELPQRQEADPAAPGAVDHRDVDELLDFINSTEPKPVNSAKAAKRARHKQKKKEKERALQGVSETACGERRSSSPPEPAEEEEPVPDGEAGRLLEWPQLELERVNSFLTSRLEEIKNTIKDSIRASFSMYDLNLDVNDFPKKAATLEGNHLLSHLNGSSDLQHVDLDLAPLSLRSFKRDLEIVNGWGEEGPATGPAPGPTHVPPPAAKAVQRLHSTPSLSKVIRVRSPERSSPPGSETAQPGPAPTAPKLKDEASDGKNATGPGAKTKKTKKQQQRQQQDQALHDQPAAPRKTTPGSQEKTQEVRPAEPEKPSRGGARAGPQNHPHESMRGSGRKAEDGKPSKHSANGAPNGNHHSGPGAHRGKGDADARGSRTDHEVEGRNVSNSPANTNLQQQPKGKTKKNRSKTEKSSNAIDDVFLPKDLDPTEMDEIDREVEHFKRFCLDSAKQTRQKVAVNWSNFSLKKMPSNAAQ